MVSDGLAEEECNNVELDLRLVLLTSAALCCCSIRGISTPIVFFGCNCKFGRIVICKFEITL